MKLRLRAAAAGLAIAFVLPMFATAASAQSGENIFAKRTIEVDGSGETRTSPDTADLDLAIDTQAKTAEEAAARNAALATKVIDALKSKLGDKGKVSTGGYSLNAQYDERPRPSIIGYNAQNSVTVNTGALDLVGALIDSAIAAGANRVNSLNFSVKDDTKARTEAIAIATRDARAQAEALASALNIKLGKVLKATTVSEQRPLPMMHTKGMAMAMSANVATPVEPGEVTVPATVSLTFEIE
jgi:uncharacterized protein YggE